MKYSEGKKNISFNVSFRFAHTYTHMHPHSPFLSLLILLSKHTLARLGHNASLAFYFFFVYVVFLFFFFSFFFLFFCHSPPLHSPIRRNKCTFIKTYLYLMYTRAAPLTKTHEKERGKKKKKETNV